MTTETFVPAPAYTVSGTGPYAIGHDYTDGAIRAQVVLDGVEAELTEDVDFTVAPEAPAASGDLTLSGAAATAWDGGTLTITRSTTLEQGFAGQTARETAMERQLDRTVQSLQEYIEGLDGIDARLDGHDIDIAAALEAAEAAAGGLTFDSVAAMAASTGLAVGQYAWTRGYHTPGDGGGNQYQIVSAGTGTADGGTYIDLAGSGTQARGLFPDGWYRIRQFGAKGDANRLTGAGTDDTAAIRACFDTPHKNIRIDAGIFRVTGAISNIVENRRVVGMGAGECIGTEDARLHFNAASILLATGTGLKRQITRREYRATSGAAAEPGRAAVIENWGGGSQFRQFAIECFCDYTDATPTNYGAAWDIGFFNGCRGGVIFEDCTVLGYFRQASTYWDVTHSFNIPNLLDIYGNPVPIQLSEALGGGDPTGSVRPTGADQCGVYRCHMRGGRVAIALLGAKGETWDEDFHDWVTDTIYPDTRGVSGASDFRTRDNALYSVNHHSGWRATDPAEFGGTLTYAGMAGEPDDTGAVVYIDVRASEVAENEEGPEGGVHSIVLDDLRYVSWEPFQGLRVDRCRNIKIGPSVHCESGSGLYTVRDTAGNTISPANASTTSYRFLATTENTGWVRWENMMSDGVDQAWVYDWSWTRVTDTDGTERSPERGWIDLEDDAGGAIRLDRVRGGGQISISAMTNSFPKWNYSGDFFYDVKSSAELRAKGSLIGTDIQIIGADTVPTAANVTDGKLGLSAHSDGTIRLFNRIGSAHEIHWSVD